MIEIPCKECGKSFKLYPSQIGQRSRCPECRVKKRVVHVKCAICGKPFEINPFRYKNSKTKEFYCSQKCWGEQVSQNITGDGNPRYSGGMVTVACVMCGKEKQVVPARAEKQTAFVCDSTGECHRLWQRMKHKGNKSALWKGGQVEITCAYCGKKVKRYPSQVEHRFCDRNCFNSWMRESGIREGENNGRWNGGTSFEPYPPGFKEALKEKIRDRDNRTCQICGKPESENGRRLEVHHIDYNKDNLSPGNLISLCRSCHSKTNVNRAYWQEYFSHNRAPSGVNPQKINLRSESA